MTRYRFSKREQSGAVIRGILLLTKFVGIFLFYLPPSFVLFLQSSL